MTEQINNMTDKLAELVNAMPYAEAEKVLVFAMGVAATAALKTTA